MAQAASPLGSGLIAIILITRSRPGPRLVFNYPAEVDVEKVTHNHADSDSDSDSDKEACSRSGLPSVFNTGISSGDPKNHAGRYFLGLSIETLEKLLSPGRWSDGKKFEVAIDDMVFLGHPVYAQEDGKWNPDQPESKQKSQRKDAPSFLKMTSTPDQRDLDFSHIPNSFDSRLGVSMATSADSESTTSGVVPDQMNMFHVVFVMRSSRHERAQEEVFAMYNDVARRLSRALQYCQKEHNYVATESRKLAALRAKANTAKGSLEDLWSQMSETSELAWGIREIYSRISQGNIATLRLYGTEISLQLKSRVAEGTLSQSISPRSAILLLESKESILADLSHPDSSLLVHFVREQTPTKSLQKQANNSGMPITDILYLAHHLVKWRKGRIISPLHRRNTYVIHPHAPLHDLRVLHEKYAQQFPSHLPSLSHMLKILGGKPVRYGQIPPSRDHRLVYMEILAFLVREGLVQQMVTYGWLKLPLDFEAQQREELIADRQRSASAMSLLSPAFRSNADDDESASVISERTTLPPAAWRSPPAVPASKANKRSSSATSNGAVESTQDREEENLASLSILDPMKPSEKEARLIKKVKQSLDKPEMRGIFSSILPYLDGEHVVEEIAARVGLKRAQVDECIAELEVKRIFAKVMVLADGG